LTESAINIHPIRTACDHRAALKTIESLMGARRNSPKGQRLDVWVTRVEAYEREKFPPDLPDPVQAIRFRMDQNDLTAKNLQPIIGRLNRVYEILNRKRPLTLDMIWKLHRTLGLPADSLIKQPQRSRD
jgi:HTH-type transcriptional regulator/antitoxin HigA